MIIAPKAIDLYANKMSKAHRLYGISWIALAFIQYFIDSFEFSLIVICVYPLVAVYQFIFRKILTGKVYMMPIVLITLALSIISIPIGYSYIESSVVVENEQIKITGIYGEKIPLNQVSEVFLADTLPGINIRTNGISTGTINKGYFRSKSLRKNVKLLLHSNINPCIYIIYGNNNKYVILNFRKKEKNLQVYDQLKKSVGNNSEKQAWQ